MATRVVSRRLHTPNALSSQALSVEENFSPSREAEVKLTYLVDWSVRNEFVLQMLGWSELSVSSDGLVAGVERIPPLPYKGSLVGPGPENVEGWLSVGLPWLYATDVELIEGLSPAGIDALGAPLYEKAKITIVYRPLHYKVKDDRSMVRSGHYFKYDGEIFIDESYLDRYVTRFLRPVVESREIPLGRWKWAEGSLRGKWSGAPLRHTVSFLEVIYIWRQVPVSKDRNASAPPAYHVPVSVPQALGAVNKTAFDNFPEGTLQLTSVLVKPYRWWNNYFYADIIYTCKYFNAKQPSSGLEYNPPKGHNYFLHTPTKDDGSFEAFEYRLATHDGNETGIRVNREFEFRDLFRPDPVS